VAIELGNISLDKLTHVAVKERTRIVRHAIPGMSGDLLQSMGRPSIEVVFHGIFYGGTATTALEQLRNAYLERQPLDFFTESIGEGYFNQVLITDLCVSQRAEHAEQFDYSCTVVEYIEPPLPAIADPLSGIDSDLISEAVASIDDMQNALDQVSQLTDMIANAPSFGNPTSQLNRLPTEFITTVTDGTDILTTLRDLF
jgi:hypothetical protein